MAEQTATRRAASDEKAAAAWAMYESRKAGLDESYAADLYFRLVDRALDRITGDAWDFALVVTQRRALADTSLQATAGPAAQWLRIAQAFAGEPPPQRSGVRAE